MMIDRDVVVGKRERPLILNVYETMLKPTTNHGDTTITAIPSASSIPTLN